MYSRLDAIFRTQFRPTEATDAGLHIRREEKQDGRRKQQTSDDKDDDNSLWEDSAQLSVKSIQGFLEGLLSSVKEDRGAQKSDFEANTRPQSKDIKDDFRKVRKVQPPKARAAVQAYQTTAKAIGHDLTPPEPVSEIAENESRDITLSTREIHEIRQLINDLKILAEEGGEYLSLCPASSFLQSLRNAVSKSIL